MWFINSSNQQTGPFDERDIAVGLAQGVYNAHTMVWRAGWPQWAPLAHSELAKYLPKVPMPPMPMPTPASAPMYATPSSRVPVRDRIFGGIGMVWGSAVFVNGVLTGIRSLTGFLFSLVMILVGGYYCFGKPKRYFAFMGIAAIGLIFFAVAKFPNRSATEATTKASVGDTFRTEKFEITITSAGERSSVGSEFFVQQPSTGATFIAVQATIKNISSRPINSFSMPDIHLIAPDGIRFDPDIGASSSFATELDSDEKVFSDLNPGITVKSGNVFEVAKDQFDKTTWRLFVDADESVYVTFEPAANQPGQVLAEGANVKINTDVFELAVDLNGADISTAKLKTYTVSMSDKTPVALVERNDAHWIKAQSGLIAQVGAAPNHLALYKAPASTLNLADGQNFLEVPFTWTDASGVTVRKIYHLERGSFFIGVRFEVVNKSPAALTLFPYRQLQQGEPVKPDGTFFAIYSPDERLVKFPSAKFADQPLKKTFAGGWMALLQHHFIISWIPEKAEGNEYTTAVLAATANTATAYLIRQTASPVSVPAGATQVFPAKLYVGPKLQSGIFIQ